MSLSYLYLNKSLTAKLLACFIVLTIMMVTLFQWVNYQSDISNSSSLNTIQTPSTVFTENEVTMTDGISSELTLKVIALVDKLSWYKGDTSLYVSALTLFIFLAFATSIGLPRQVAALVAGLNFGALTGFFIATAATTLGCFITFTVSRYLLRKKITEKFPTKIEKLSALLTEQTFLKALVIRILPLGSNFLTNIIAGVTKVSMSAYVSGSFVGFIPQMIIFSLAGSGIRLGAQSELLISVVLFIIACLLGAYLLKKHKSKFT